MERASAETWAKRVERWKDSGLPARTFASEVGLNEHSLRWWHWRLGADARKRARARPAAAAPAKSTALVKSKPTPPVSALTFVEMSAALGSDALEVVLTTSVRIRVRPEFDAATLTRLLDVLERR
jgi:hypothetical protein